MGMARGGNDMYLAQMYAKGTGKFFFCLPKG